MSELADKVWLLKERQSFSLKLKKKLTKRRIKEWYRHWGGKVYVGFSGGKDSTVLLHMVRKYYPKVPAVFVDTGLEFPEIRKFVKSVDNVIWLKPNIKFPEVIKKYGYPVVSKEVAHKIDQLCNTKNPKVRSIIWSGYDLSGNKKVYGKLPEKWKFLLDARFNVSDKCCYALKKSPTMSYERRSGRKPFIGTMASDSSLRERIYLRSGCNSFESSRPQSLPMSFWLEKDIWKYLKKYNVPYSTIYDMEYKRTGCMFCMFGVHMEKGENRFQLMKRTHPKQYAYCINKLGCGSVLDYIGVEY